MRNSITAFVVTLLIGILAFLSGVNYNRNGRNNTIAPFPEKTIIRVEESLVVDMNKVFLIESNNNSNAISLAGARGIGQLMRGTWDECVKKMGKDWNYDTDWNDREKNSQVSDFYINNRIPKMLTSYGIPDTIETRLAAYNCGIGRLDIAYKEYGRNWKEHLPEETQNYIKKYWGK